MKNNKEILKELKRRYRCALNHTEFKELLSFVDSSLNKSRDGERERIAKALDASYHDDNENYPPFKLNVFSDRAVYHQYMVKRVRSLD